jgi:hypothetical protein
MASLKLFLLPNGYITLSRVVATYPVVVYHLLLVIECKEVVVAMTSYATRITITISSKYL